VSGTPRLKPTSDSRHFIGISQIHVAQGRARRLLREINTLVRYLLFVLHKFRWSVGIFWGLVLVGGLIVHLFYHADGRRIDFGEACWGVFLLVFGEAYLSFPDEWFLRPLFFAVPVIGLAALADSLVRLGYLLFTRKHNLPEWHRMVASLNRDHVIVVGLGKVGYQIVRELLDLRESVVAVERLDVVSGLVDELVEIGVPVVRGDGRSAKTLEAAGMARARGVVLSTSDDLTNLDAALVARDLNPAARVVLRLFDESLARKVEGAFHLPAISTARVAAPTFAAAATGRKVYQEFTLGDEKLHLVDVTVCDGGRLAGRTVGEIQRELNVNLVMHRGPNGVHVNPGHDQIVTNGDVILVIARLEKLLELEAVNR
jgi:voltage-gated potassium channel